MIMCPDCLKPNPIYSNEICKKCYMKVYNQIVIKKKQQQRKNDYWQSVKITATDKELLRLSLLRMKYSYETDFDYMLVNHIYLKYKADYMPDWPFYGIKSYINRIIPQLKLIFNKK